MKGQLQDAFMPVCHSFFHDGIPEKPKSCDPGKGHRYEKKVKQKQRKQRHGTRQYY